ncbi:hypothetical protein CEXT_387911, partial [Caerostris extrusa]
NHPLLRPEEHYIKGRLWSISDNHNTVREDLRFSVFLPKSLAT